MQCFICEIQLLSQLNSGMQIENNLRIHVYHKQSL